MPPFTWITWPVMYDAQGEAIADNIDRTLDPRFGYGRAERRSEAR